MTEPEDKTLQDDAEASDRARKRAVVITGNMLPVAAKIMGVPMSLGADPAFGSGTPPTIPLTRTMLHTHKGPNRKERRRMAATGDRRQQVTNGR